MSHRPDWLKVRIPSGENFFEVRRILRSHKLNTICEDAMCPNIAECWGSHRTATFMILGDICTRACAFCAVTSGKPTELDLAEPERVAALEIENMARFNFAQATGRELAADFVLPLQRPFISDSQMMPYQWFQPEDGGNLLKLDAAAHGDNHFFPGPVDIAWDAAGAIIEWEMDEVHTEYFSRRYRELSQDEIGRRLSAYLVAYAAFRNGYCRMAASTMANDPAEAQRLLRDANRYRAVLEELVPEKTLSAAAYE